MGGFSYVLMENLTRAKVCYCVAYNRQFGEQFFNNIVDPLVMAPKIYYGNSSIFLRHVTWLRTIPRTILQQRCRPPSDGSQNILRKFVQLFATCYVVTDRRDLIYLNVLQNKANNFNNFSLLIQKTSK
jgi:hypothetical protein